MSTTIKLIGSDAEIARCYAVMVQLRPHLTLADFVAQVKLQMRSGYQLVAALGGDTVVAVAGYRVTRSLSWGKFLYVDDLVTDAARRSQGIGKRLLDWLRAEAKRQGCQEFHLDSGTQRKDAHRFYEREGMQLLAYHYKLRVQ